MHPLQLPELMAIVAKYLDANVREARRLTRVCHVWYTVFSPTVWRKCPVNNAFIKNDQAVQGLARNASHIRILSFHDLSFLSRLVPRCTQLRELTIKHSLDLGSDGTNAAEKWNLLTGFILENSPHLRMISISASCKPATTDFWAVLGSCARVHIGQIQATMQQTRVFWEGCSNVEELTVHHVQLPHNGDFFEEAKGRGGNWALKKLEFLGEPTVGMIRFLVQCKHLTSLAMRCSWQARNHGPATLATFLEQGYLSQLEELTLKGHVTDEDSPSCLRAMRHLKHLDCRSTRFGPISFTALAGHFASIQTLRLSNSNVFGDMNQIVLESCPQLTEFCSTPIDGSWIEQGQPWVCLGLNRLAMGIIIVDTHNSERDDIREQSRVVFRELGRLTQLEVLDISMKEVVVPLQGLYLRLASGMRVLASLLCLRRLDFTNTRQVMYAPDIAFLKSLKHRNVSLLGTLR